MFTRSLISVLCLSVLLPSVTPAQDLFELPKPPGELDLLMEAGSVEFLFYDQRPADQKFEGETHFNFDVGYRFRYQSRLGNKQGVPHHFVSVHFSNIRIETKNIIRIPRRYASVSIWDSSLVQHEFEHVRVNSDPRVELLIQELVNAIKRIDIKAKSRTISRAELTERVEKEIDKRVDEVTRLVQGNNDLLDTVTQHGISTSSRDPNFFYRLFTPENLADQKFSYSDDVKSLLKSKKYVAFSKSDQSR